LTAQIADYAVLAMQSYDFLDETPDRADETRVK